MYRLPKSPSKVLIEVIVDLACAGENGKEGKRESNNNGKEGEWEGTLGRGCGG